MMKCVFHRDTDPECNDSNISTDFVDVNNYSDIKHELQPGKITTAVLLTNKI